MYMYVYVYVCMYVYVYHRICMCVCVRTRMYTRPCDVYLCDPHVIVPWQPLEISNRD